MNEYLPITITDVVDECRNVKTLRFRSDEPAFNESDPGNFSMVRIPEKSANPISFSYGKPPGFTIRKIDDMDKDETDGAGNPVTSFAYEAFKLKPEDTIFATRPKGNSFYSFLPYNLSKDFCLMAGGCAAAPIAYLCEELCAMDLGNHRVQVLLGARTKDELLFEQRMYEVLSQEHGDRLLVSTDDESYGEPGTAVDLIDQADLKKGETSFVICGPEKMMKAAAEKIVREGYAKPGDIGLLLERYMKCVKGVCAACDCGGKRVCEDGAVFSYEEMQDNPHFGKYRRRKSGLLEPI